MIGGAVPAFADITTGLAARWSFDDCSANDSSGNGNNGAKIGGLTCVTGMMGKAMQFDGATGYIAVPDSYSLKPDKQWTMSFWIKTQGTPSGSLSSPILHKGGLEEGSGANRVYTVWLLNDMSFHQTSAGGDSVQHMMDVAGITKNQWVQYVGVIDRVNHVMSIWLNGKKVAEAPDSYGDFNANDHELRIGWTEEEHSTYGFFQGILDDIRLYDRALTKDEIAALYNIGQPVAGVTTGLKQYEATCRNASTGQRVRIPTRTATAWDCKKAGLKTAPSQNIEITIKGKTYP